MSNYFLPSLGTIFNPIAKYKVFTSYDPFGNPKDFKHDLDLKKIGFSDKFLIDAMMNKSLKLIDYRIMAYVFHNMTKGCDEVCLNPKIIGRYIKKGRSTVSDSINRLCSLGILYAVKGKGVGRKYKYQINVNYFFHGDRINFLESIDNKYVTRVL